MVGKGVGERGSLWSARDATLRVRWRYRAHIRTLYAHARYSKRSRRLFDLADGLANMLLELHVSREGLLLFICVDVRSAVGLVSRAFALNKLDISSNEIYAY